MLRDGVGRCNDHRQDSTVTLGHQAESPDSNPGACSEAVRRPDAGLLIGQAPNVVQILDPQRLRLDWISSLHRIRHLRPNFAAGFPTAHFPWLYRDACAIARILGIRYLWIDALVSPLPLSVDRFL